MIMMSLLHSKSFPYKPETTFAQWVSNRFGKRLFEIFFRAYTEKVWGVSCDTLSSDWAAQRIRNLSLSKAFLRAVGIGRRGSVTSLIGEFDYPLYGPGQMYEAMARKAADSGVHFRLNWRVISVEHKDGKVRGICASRGKSRQHIGVTKACFSSMPLDELVLSLSPSAPLEVVRVARCLRYRSFITVNLLLNCGELVPDNWIYIHAPEVRAARIQFYKNWSPKMVPCDDQSVISLEYFCDEDDAFWRMPDDRLREIAVQDMTRMKFGDPNAVFDSFCVRYAKAYPVYDEGYAQRVKTIRQYLRTITNLYPIGRYGQFRYNNMDHSILTAKYSLLAMDGEDIDPWEVNDEQEYHEEKRLS
jgi:protoporphyrinogen oxidase